MSARCPEGHLSQDPDYCDQCGLRITSGQDSYSYRSDDRGAQVGSYGGGSSHGGGGAGGYDPLGIRRDTDPDGRGPARGADPYAGDQYGGGYGPGAASGYDERPARSAYSPDAYDPDSGYAPRGRVEGRDGLEGRDPGGYAPRGRDGRDDPDAGYPARGRDGADGRDRDAYARGRDSGSGGYAPRVGERDDYGRDQYGRDAGAGAGAGTGTGTGAGGYARGGRDDAVVDRDGYGGRGGRDSAGVPGERGYGYEADPLGVDDRGERAARPDRAAPGAGGRYPQCPNCRAFHEPGARFCENCGLDFTTGHVPGSAPGATGRRQTGPPREDADYGQPVITGSAANWNGGGGGAVATTWEAVVEAEREYYDSGDDHRVPFPSFYPRRVFPLSGPRLLVGRRSESRGIHPEIDLSGAPEDPGISRAHAIFERQPDGSYALLDPGSTNGTRLNDEPDPVEPNGRIPLQDGDRVYLGAWTRVTIRAR
ncbi:FHA domain-containing protein [Pseudofrankia sp. BMG5.37]|uniref:FHA domain-containing protein n=1 Tax=Pseudofrankia sp. BMG5.37 TaxID=3050035 RepID=UPI0028939679|nr:FHA domain-containing protein [Pseudofrankia sp. BMG5.37]MDT3441711.1 FHA domain-containing protein [Pseudofrankia sp. BMG5.37]